MQLTQELIELVFELEEKFYNLRNKKILITGSSGFLGFYFSHLFLMANKKFNLGINLTLTSQTEVHKSLSQYEFSYYKGNLLDKNFITSFNTYDSIINLAGFAQPARFLLNPIDVIKINTEVCEQLLKRLRNSGQFLFISSSEIYTNSKNLPATESDIGSIKTDNLRAPYIYSKLLGESICMKEISSCKKDIKIARLSTVYGPGFKINDKRVVSELIEQGLQFKNIRLLDQGTAVREYLYITDAIRALFNITFFGKSPLYNIGSGKLGSITIKELAEKIAQLTQSGLSLPIHESNDLHASGYVALDVTKYEREFGKILNIPLDKGLGNTIDWVRNNCSN
jgi:dTDP-glucose 4,6-dehydratase/UDP-glucuronate decarboxylase